MRTAVGVFEPMEAGQVIDDLISMGCDKARMSVIAHPPSTGAAEPREDLSAHIAGLHGARMAEVGDVFIAGPLGERFAGSDLRAALVANGLSSLEADSYVEELKGGGAIVAAEVDETHLQRVLSVMGAHAHAEHRRSAGAQAAEATQPAQAAQTSQAAQPAQAAQTSPDARVPEASTRSAQSAPTTPARAPEAAEARSAAAASSAQGAAGGRAESEIAIPVVQEEMHVGKREVESGGVRVTRTISEQPVEQQIPLHKEKVTVERRSLERPAGAADAPVGERSFEVHERHEEPIVQKSARAVEEVIIHKEASDEPATVRGTVRREDVTVDPLTDEVARFGGDLRRSRTGDWPTIEEGARRDWESRRPGTWEKVKAAVRSAFEHADRK
ncbi:MAG TPA: DUF2382 domain-containing protein [Polyangiaceae bacterium]|nr:DUF2382 domain-containing protein [Polyangiaceae bacterium]